MTSFLSHTAADLLKHYPDLKDLKIVLPSRRAAVFLKKELSRQISQPVWSPPIWTIEEFLLENLGLEQADQATLLFRLYDAYREVSSQPESFAEFSQWAQLLLADFNEVDRYLVDARELFSYLADVERIRKWDLKGGEPTEMLQKYLALWEHLPKVYEQFYANLLADQRVYQGMAYREMANQLDQIIPPLRDEGQQLIFIGFNALNKAEEKIMLRLYEEGLARFYWDVDRYYFEDRDHEAGKFLRDSKLVRTLREKDEFFWLSGDLQNVPKKIEVLELSGDQQQAIAANAAVLDFKARDLEDVAVVMADENLLTPFLSQLSEQVEGLNITMGLALNGSLAAGFFNLLLAMLQEQSTGQRKDGHGNPAYHFQRWDDLLGHALFKRWIGSEKDAEKLRAEIRRRNYIYISAADIVAWQPGFLASEKVNFFNQDFRGRPVQMWQSMAELCQELHLKRSEQNTLLQSLYGFFQLFNRLADLMTSYPYVEDVKTAVRFFRDLIRHETLDIEGDPLSGLQLMGMLETRTLDFPNLIITSLNEDVLPKGRSENSLIPYDIKSEFGLPTYLDKDAVYAYHFYRLLQRAEHVTLIYNGHSEGMGSGEASRFIRQLEFELPKRNKKVEFTRSSPHFEVQAEEKEVVSKTPALMQRLEEMAERGISPTALIQYVGNPLNFYRRKVLGLKEPEEVEEVAAMNTQGNVVHGLLEKFYSTSKGQPKATLNSEDPVFQLSEADIRREVVIALKAEGLSRLDSGKNLLVREVLTGMIHRLLKEEKRQLEALKEKGLVLSLLGLEQKLAAQVELSNGMSVKIHGELDRVDRIGDEVRVIDYKTGSVAASKLKFKEMEHLRMEAKDLSKPLQLMTYAWLYLKNNPEVEWVKTAIISTRNVSAWLMPCTYMNSDKISREEIMEFESVLRSLLDEIYDPDTTFAEKLVPSQ